MLYVSFLSLAPADWFGLGFAVLIGIVVVKAALYKGPRDRQ